MAIVNATPTKFLLGPEHRGLFSVPNPDPDSAAKTAELLQKNHDDYHMYFNVDGFHNHILHHLFAAYALGAPSSTLEHHFAANSSYQMPHKPLSTTALAEIRNPQTFDKYLAQRKHYHDYLAFFTEEIEKEGQDAVINKYLFKCDKRADDMLVRLFAGFLHPLIHLGYGVEWQQPAVVAEALAQAATHDNWIGEYLLPAEKAAKERGHTDETLVDLLGEVAANKKLKASPQWSHSNKIRDGILVYAPQEMINIGAKWTVQEHELEKKTAEMINFAAYFTGTALRPSKAIKFDFYFMHCLNSTILARALLTSPAISPTSKCRLLEWKGRVDLCMYVSRASPPLLTDEIRTYPRKDGWPTLFERIVRFPDDGHASKFVRALAHGEAVMRQAGVRDGDARFRVESADWLLLANMLVDSVEAPGPSWVMGTGFDEAWQSIGERPKPQL